MRVTKTVALVLAALAALVAAGRPASGQEFPTRPINLIIPFGAGGSSDLTTRTFIGLAREVVGQPMVVHLKPGGGGAIGS